MLHARLTRRPGGDRRRVRKFGQDGSAMAVENHAKVADHIPCEATRTVPESRHSSHDRRARPLRGGEIMIIDADSRPLNCSVRCSSDAQRKRDVVYGGVSSRAGETRFKRATRTFSRMCRA